MAGAALVGCTKNEPAADADQQMITFAAPVVSPNTKAATEVWNNYPTAGAYDFAVWAKYYVNDSYESNAYKSGTYTTWAEGKTYMKEVVVSHNANTWAPKQNYYWPKNGSLTFIAYAPASKANYAEATATGITFTNYPVSYKPAEQVDLLFSERTYNQQKSSMDETAGSNTTGSTPDVKNDAYTGVHISFKHALSSILFNIKTEKDYVGTTITLKQIQVYNAVSQGSFNQNLVDENGATTTVPDDIDATNPAAWTFAATPVKSNYNVDINNTAGVVLSTAAYYPSTNSNTAPVVANGLRASDLILLPQDLEGVTLRIEYTIKNSGEGSEELSQIAELPLAGNTVSEWVMGKRYIYNIKIGLETIYFEPYVQDWVDVAAGDLTI
jgi:hypothetical protein